MAEFLADLPVTRMPQGQHYGAAGNGVRVVVSTASMASVVAAKGGRDDFNNACERAVGVWPVDGPVVTASADLAFIGTGPGRWLVVGESGTLAQRLTETLGPLAAVCDQSDAYILFDIDGDKARACMTKGALIDFTGGFGPGDAATTVIDHIGVTLWQAGGAPHYRIAVGRSFAPSFARGLLTAAAEYGVAWSDRGT